MKGVMLKLSAVIMGLPMPCWTKKSICFILRSGWRMGFFLAVTLKAHPISYTMALSLLNSSKRKQRITRGYLDLQVQIMTHNSPLQTMSTQVKIKPCQQTTTKILVSSNFENILLRLSGRVACQLQMHWSTFPSFTASSHQQRSEGGQAENIPDRKCLPSQFH